VYDFPQSTLGNPASIALKIDLILALDLDLEILGQRIHDRDSHP